MDCNCAAPEGCEHYMTCPMYEPYFTDAERRQLRAILAGGSHETAGGTLVEVVEDWHGKALHPEPL